MNLLLDIPAALLLAVVFFLGAVVAGLLNLGVYRLGWQPRTISPWGPAPAGAEPRGWLDRLPIIGWLRLRREVAIHGRGFWIRPLLVELTTGAAFAALSWWEVQCSALLPLRPWQPLAMLPPGRMVRSLSDLTLTFQPLLAHLLLLSLMLVATLIDIDEMTIPDEITVPGTLLGLLLAALLPWSLLPAERFVVVPSRPPIDVLEFLHVASPAAWPHELAAFPRWQSLALGLGCYFLWCFALLPRTWYRRHGVRRALQLCLARIAREGATRVILLLAAFGAAAIGGVWYHGGPNWAAMLSSLVGMAAGGGIVWAVRLIGAAVMHREAMGFGDVTLMAMIGSFVGWQACLLIFFLAPLAGVFLGIARWLLRRDREIPYGPFLCLATLVIIVAWSPVWNAARDYFMTLGRIIPIMAVACLALMALLLWMLQMAKRLLFRGGSQTRA